MVSIADASARIGYRDEHTDYEADELFAFLLAKHHRHNHYASDAQRFHFKMLRARQALAGLCVAASVGGLLWAGTQVVDGMMYRQELAKTTELLTTAEARNNEVQARLPQTEVAPEDMRLAVAAADQLRQQRYNPHDLLARLGQGLQRQSSLRINQIDWFVSSDRYAKATTLAADDTQQAVAVEYDEEGNPLETASAEGAYQIGIVQGRVQPFEGNFSRAHQHIADLLNTLRTTPGVIAAEALELPLNTATSGRVLGSIGDDSSKLEAPFTLRLVLGANHG
jgi:hypothetical protein